LKGIGLFSIHEQSSMLGGRFENDGAAGAAAYVTKSSGSDAITAAIRASSSGTNSARTG